MTYSILIRGIHATCRNLRAVYYDARFRKCSVFSGQSLDPSGLSDEESLAVSVVVLAALNVSILIFHISKKLKTYSSLNAVLDSHSEILRERSETMDLARQEAVKKAGIVLG